MKDVSILTKREECAHHLPYIGVHVQLFSYKNRRGELEIEIGTQKARWGPIHARLASSDSEKGSINVFHSSHHS